MISEATLVKAITFFKFLFILYFNDIYFTKPMSFTLLSLTKQFADLLFCLQG